MKYDLLVDGERAARVGSEEDVRGWIARYRQDHADDDPAATHVQVLERPALAWLRGGTLLDRERFL
jgi:hypothetical protein